MDGTNPPTSSNLYNMTYPMGNEKIIQKIADGIIRENKTKKLLAW